MDAESILSINYWDKKIKLLNVKFVDLFQNKFVINQRVIVIWVNTV